ncbi:hypothetical protein Fmac_017678 [Flemingia macrophylla]|uniref:Uncharacterized protein n=1 Tax=Flemingia macrophylla TaxID=520843 RepID=A0ABD1M2S1_9FABA
MERDLEELKNFPQYFGFSLTDRIVPRHLHLKERAVRIPLNKMLMWADQKFYAKLLRSKFTYASQTLFDPRGEIGPD